MVDRNVYYLYQCFSCREMQQFWQTASPANDLRGNCKIMLFFKDPFKDPRKHVTVRAFFLQSIDFFGGVIPPPFDLPSPTVYPKKKKLNRKALLKKMQGLFRHCPNCDCTPTLHSNGHFGALYFRADSSKFVKSLFSRYVSARKHPDKP